MAGYINKILGGVLSEEEMKTIIIYSDTDSVYLSLEKLVDKYKDKIPKGKTVEFLDKFIESKLQPEIDLVCQEIADYFNFFQNTMGAKREAIAESGIWCVHPNSVVNSCGRSETIEEMYHRGVWLSDGVSKLDDSYVDSVCEENMNVVSDEVAYVFRKRYTGKMYKFTSNGRTVTVTSDHLMCVLKEDKIVWTKAKDVVETDELLIMENLS